MIKKKANFSVIMPLYSGTVREEFELAFSSILNSDLLPVEIIIVLDGNVNFCVNEIIKFYHSPVVTKVHKIEINIGPGFARNIAVSLTSTPIIALMDSDDICRKNRFSQQYKYLTEMDFDVVGGIIEEFRTIPGDLGQFRTVPEFPEIINKKGKFFQPLNNVTMMFKKSVFNQVDGYAISRYVEDYDLIFRMILSGCKFYNVQKVLVDVRLGNNYLYRRTGLKYFLAEQKLMVHMYRTGYLKTFQYIINILLRACFRLFQSKSLLKLQSQITRSFKLK